jgi:twitching motility two-component system response regulator PilH
MRGVGRWLNDVRGRWRGGLRASRKLPSLVRAMDDLVPRKVMREVVASSHDRRQWGVLAAAWVGVSEREFFQAAARAMGVPLEEHIVAPDLSVFGSQARPLLSELRRIGAIVVLEGNTTVRIIAVDPAEVRALSVYEPHIPVSLASWSELARSLDAAERMLVENESNSDYREAKRRQEVCGKILSIIIREATAHGSQSVEIVTLDGKTRYQFSTSHGKIATGAIRPEVVQELLKYLCGLDGSILKNETHGEVVLRSLGGASNFRLSWGAARAVRPQSDPIIVHAEPDGRIMQAASHREVGADHAAVSTGYVSQDLEDEPVLVIDDNPMFCRVLERLLRREGVCPDFAENGVVALEKLEAAGKALPRVIICDLHMPVMNGREFLSRLKSDSRLRSIPIIMLTSDDDIDAEVQLLAEGADAFVSKAKDPRVLTTQVQRFLRPGALRRAA